MHINVAEDLAILSAHKKPNQLQPYGFRRVNLRNPSLTDFIPIHNGHIKDIKRAYNGSGMILSTSLDKTLKLTSLKSKQVVQR